MAKLLADYEIQGKGQGRVHTIGLGGGADDGYWPNDIPAPAPALLFCHQKVFLREVEVVDGSW